MQLNDKILKRLWKKVNKNSGHFGIDGKYPTECWEWTAKLTGKGYGRFWPLGKKGFHAHRFVWIITFGDIDEDICVCHKCDNRKCVRPDHLFTGTQTENILDMDNKKRRIPPIGESHGHCKLTEIKVLKIRQLHFDHGYRYCDLAKQFNISHGTAMDIIKRRSWKHI